MEIKVLIADDDRDIINLIRMRLLQRFDCEIFEAYDGLEALDLARINSLNLLILDILMPKLSGEKVFAEVRKDPSIRQVPILFCTAVNNRDFLRKLLLEIKDNITDMVIKPIQFGLMYGKIEKLIEKGNLLSEPLPVNEFGLGACLFPQIGLEYAIQVLQIEGINPDDEYSVLINNRIHKGRILTEHKPIIKVPFNEDGTPARILFQFLYSKKRNMRIYYKII